MQNNNLQKTGKAIGFRMIDPHYREPKKAPFVVPDVTMNKKEAAFCKWHNLIFFCFLCSFLDEMQMHFCPFQLESWTVYSAKSGTPIPMRR